MAGSIIGDALIRIVIDPAAAESLKEGQKGPERPRPAAKSKDTAKRSSGKGDANLTDWDDLDEHIYDPEAVARKVSKDHRDETADLLRRNRKAQADAKKRLQGAGKSSKQRKKEAEEGVRAALRQKAARIAIAGRATRRFLNRTVPVIGRAATIGKQAAQTLAPLAGISASAVAGAGIGAGVGATVGVAKFGHQISQFAEGVTGAPTGTELEKALLRVFTFGTAGDPTVTDLRYLLDLAPAVGAAFSAYSTTLASSGSVASLGGQNLDQDTEREMAERAMRNAYVRSIYEQGVERRLSGVAAKGVGSAFHEAFNKFLAGYQQR